MRLIGIFTVFLFFDHCNYQEDNETFNLNENVSSQVYSWFKSQQLANGLVESIENGNSVSLYDNALAAMIFMLNGEYTRAEKIFDYFNAQRGKELKKGVGGFSQFRTKTGAPNNHRWMGDNAWLLIALNNYKAKTGKSQYDQLALEIKNWLMSLQDIDGGLFAGYNTDDSLMNFKVTEGMIDAFNAIEGYTSFHQQLLIYLKNNRWSADDKNLLSWPTNPPYLYAMDLHSWGYMIFNDYPETALSTAQRYLNTQTADVSGQTITGYCFDDDKDVVWIEGTGQMALAFGLANNSKQRDYYLAEMEKSLIESSLYTGTAGFPYASNKGTTYGPDLLWNGASDKIAVSGGAWYLFAKKGFNPFAVGRNKSIPSSEMFWTN